MIWYPPKTKNIAYYQHASLAQIQYFDKKYLDRGNPSGIGIAW